MDEYEGIPLEQLRIDAVDWTHRAEHIRRRSERKGREEFDIEPEWATEGALDSDRIVRTTRGRSIKVIGWSPSAPGRGDQPGRLLKIWLVPKDLDAGEWWGASAAAANSTDRRRYEELQGEEEGHR